MPAAEDRTLFIGFDGGTWNLLDPAMDAGAMPHLQEFLAGTLRGSLRSVEPPVTIPAWYCMTTGLSPATLDRWGFTAPTPQPGKFQLVTTYRPHEALWDRLGRTGWRVGVVNFPAMPAPSVHGTFVSGMLDPKGHRTAHPGSLAKQLATLPGGWDYDLPEFGPGQLEKALERAARSLGAKADLVESMQKEQRSDLMFVLFSETDRLQHNFWDPLAAFPHKRAPAVRRYWGALDDAFHRVLQAFHGKGTERRGYTWLVSDHGFGPSEGYFFTNRFLERQGYLTVKPGAPRATRVRPWVTSAMARADEALPLRRPLDVAEKVRKRLSPRTAEKDGDVLDQTFGWFSQFVDWRSTRAFSFPVPEAIYANPFGAPMDPAARAQLKEELKRDLTKRAPAGLRVIDPEEAYGRPVAKGAPLLLLASHEYAWETRGDTNHREDCLPRRPSYFGRQGTHRQDGILALAGPSIRPGRLKNALPLLSITPTVLALLRLSPSTPLDAPPSRVLLEAAGRPVTTP